MPRPWRALFALSILCLAASAAQASETTTKCYESCHQERAKCTDTVAENAPKTDCVTQLLGDLNNCTAEWQRAFRASWTQPGILPWARSQRHACETRAHSRRSQCEAAWKPSQEALKLCFELETKCETRCEEECYAREGDETDCSNPTTYGGGGGISYRVRPCPPGTVRSFGVLGLCEATFRGRDSSPPGEDGCPSGTRRGPDDRCVPTFTVAVAPFGDEHLLLCPPGTRPSPIDGGCVFGGGTDGGDTGAEPGRNVCPPGTTPSPDDGTCLPTISPPQPGGVIAIDPSLGLRPLPELSLEQVNAVAGYGALVTSDVAAGLEATAEALGMELVRPEETPDP